MTARITSEQQKQYKRFVEDAADRGLKEVSPDKDGLQRLFERGGEFQAYIVAGVAWFTAKAPNYDLARSILGDDFITPEDVKKARPDLAYSNDQIATLADSIPSAEVLKWCKESGYAVVAGSPGPMSLLEVRSAKSDHFYSKTEGWYAEKGEKFSRADKVSLGWLMIRKEPVPKSTNEKWEEQSALLDKAEYVPNAAEMSWFITIFYDVRGIRLFESLYVRTSSLASDGRRVIVGGFDTKGLNVYTVELDIYGYSYLGIASARKS